MKNFIYLSLLACALTFTSCDDDPEVENPEELITTVIATLSGGDTPDVVLRFEDTDGDGGNEATITGGTLAANSSYSLELQFLDESTSDVEDITEEIAEEDDEHQVFLAFGGLNATWTYNDQDGSGNPLGLSTTVTTGDAGTGTLTITLIHEPEKSASGVSEGDITNAGGETDVEVTFPVVIE